MGGERTHPGSLKPESDYIVRITDSHIRSTQPDGTEEEIMWDELSRFDIETNSLGPFAPDVFWILHGDGRCCVIPQGATGNGALLERLQQLPGFDNKKFIDAMASTSEATFEIWLRNNNYAEPVPKK